MNQEVRCTGMGRSTALRDDSRRTVRVRLVKFAHHFSFLVWIHKAVQFIPCPPLSNVHDFDVRPVRHLGSATESLFSEEFATS